jgi:hypothetical protein
MKNFSRALLTAINSGMDQAAIADILFAAATDHYFLDGGHSFDFVNKACEMLDTIGWDQASDVLPSVIPSLTSAMRSAPPETDYHLQARARLAELRLRQGRLEDAEALIADADEQPAVWATAAALRHVRGEQALAVSLLARLLEAAPPSGSFPLTPLDIHNKQ